MIELEFDRARVMGRVDVTLSPTERGSLGELLPSLAPWRQLAMSREITFCLGPSAAPATAMERAAAFVHRALPMLLKDALAAQAASDDVTSVVRELVDITSRDRHGEDILGRIVFDGTHITVSVGEKQGPLPQPDDEPGLYLVRRLVDDIGQYRGDNSGHVVWASVPVHPNAQ
ncbi:hypothetical protein [Streptomyces griseocarneus]|uniref:hypothetical protein n=1 Tax=Streptomyces griseocarneus TaxID=51201 RepID=UPI00167CC45C|nr:hypothetical protein [Streptomyces griseocarneus]MBZ6476766.1 hypothetical protein [Streptomyces griseocarneus]GHG80808.1 hypothetical protein GCM10018779_62700 [Streptomyces griseocarneus]